jgi:hypothetical protein
MPRAIETSRKVRPIAIIAYGTNRAFDGVAIRRPANGNERGHCIA